MPVKRIAPTADEYLDGDTKVHEARAKARATVYEKEDENEFSETSSFVQEGWDAANREMKKSSSRTTKYADFRFSQPQHLVKFLASDPLVFAQHWVERAPGRRSFICIKNNCPLCDRGNVPATRYGFRLVDLTDPNDLTPQLYYATPTAAAAIREQHDGRSGPIDAGYWELSKTGEGKQSRTVVRAVKPRDLADDWGLDPASAEAEVAKISDPGAALLRTPTMEELREAAEYC